MVAWLTSLNKFFYSKKNSNLVILLCPKKLGDLEIQLYFIKFCISINFLVIFFKQKKLTKILTTFEFYFLSIYHVVAEVTEIEKN